MTDMNGDQDDDGQLHLTRWVSVQSAQGVTRGKGVSNGSINGERQRRVDEEHLVAI